MAKMTATEKLIAAGWQRVRITSECGEALHGSGAKLEGLACIKGAAWRKPNGDEPARCAQHAAEQIEAPAEQVWNLTFFPDTSELVFH